jgi:hypothetical protein
VARGGGWGTRRPRWLGRFGKRFTKWTERALVPNETLEQRLGRLQRLVDKSVQRLGSQHRVVIGFKGDLAKTYEELGQWNNSEPLRRDIYAAYVQHRGAENDVTLGKEYLLVLSLLELGRKEEARDHVLHILEIRERLYNTHDALTQNYRHLLASIGPVERPIGPVARKPKVGSQTANALASFRIGVSGKSVPPGTATTGGVRRVRRPPSPPSGAP